MIVELEACSDEKESTLTIEYVFNHYIRLYFRYITIAQSVEECYDTITHPQKRDDIKEVMVLLVCRIIDLRHKIVMWNPACVDATKKRATRDDCYPWEYIDLHKYATTLRLRPNSFETPIPSFFQDDELQKQHERDLLVEGYMQLKLSVNSLPVEDKRLEKEKIEDQSNNQEVELGPEAKVHMAYDTSFRDSIVRRTKCATTIQKYFRGHLVRCEIQNNIATERRFIGMSTRDDIDITKLKQKVDDMCNKRKQIQIEIGEEYKEALVVLRDLVKREKLFDMQQSLMKERVEWVTEQIGQTNEIPDSLDEFYKNKTATGGTSETESDPVGRLNSDHKPVMERPIELLTMIRNQLSRYKKKWDENDQEKEGKRLSSNFDENLAKNIIVSDELYGEATTVVDNILMTNLRRIKALQSTTSSNAKSNNKKGGDKKKKGKSSKSKGKGKSLPGEKIQEINTMDTAHMLSVLIENKIINNVNNLKINDFIGSELPLCFTTNETSTKVNMNVDE